MNSKIKKKIYLRKKNLFKLKIHLFKTCVNGEIKKNYLLKI